MEKKFVILVDEHDNVIGKMEKLEAHKKAFLHRAISVFLINSKGEWIMQRRALNKYHSKGLWTNTCCSHPFPDESNIEAAKRRLVEEMGINCEVKEIFSFIYKENLDDNLTEYEFDHIFIGIYNGIPIINTDEVAEWKLILYDYLHHDILDNPINYTSWFKKIYQKVNIYFNNDTFE